MSDTIGEHSLFDNDPEIDAEVINNIRTVFADHDQGIAIQVAAPIPIEDLTSQTNTGQHATSQFRPLFEVDLEALENGDAEQRYYLTQAAPDGDFLLLEHRVGGESEFLSQRGDLALIVHRIAGSRTLPPETVLKDLSLGLFGTGATQPILQHEQSPETVPLPANAQLASRRKSR